MSRSGQGTHKAARPNHSEKTKGEGKPRLGLSELELQQAAEKYARMIQSSPDAITLRSLPERRYIEVNEGFTRLTGYTAQEVLGKTPAELGIWVEQKAHQDHLKAIEQEGQIQKEEFAFRTKSGEIRHGRVSAVRLQLNGEPMMLSITHDITEVKQAEEALRKSEANFRSLVENSPYGIYRVSAEGRPLLANPAVVRMLGYESEAAVLAVNGSNPAVARQLLQESWLKNEFEAVETDWRRRDGKVIKVRLTGRPVMKDGGPVWAYVEVYAEDVTERRSLERQVLQAQKMDAIGRLAGGVAHDFNNLLAVILGHSELLGEQLERGTRLQGSTEAIRKAAERGAALTMQLLAFSRKQIVEPKTVDMNEALIEMERLARRVIREDISVEVKQGRELGQIKIDPGQFDQVTMNLIVNARDAMPNGGKLVLETANVELDEMYAKQHVGISRGHYVMLAVSDTGVGMDAATLSRIFEPFFTTKEQGKGTGLGLSTVYGIVKQAGGHILPYSEPGSGTTMRIYFPRVEETGQPEAASPKRELLRGTETILVVEDEPALRELTRVMLKEAGYEVMDAGGVEEALQLVKKNGAGIRLLLTDVVMPGAGGRELAEQLKRAYPGLKVLFMSGYSDDVIAHRGVLDEPVVLIQKPFTKKVLLTRIRELLDAD